MAAFVPEKRPTKGILKAPTDGRTHPGVQWDEMNIMMTNHPADKDYGHMKIDEPKTPYAYGDASGSEHETHSDEEGREKRKLDPHALADRIHMANNSSEWKHSDEESSDDCENILTEEEAAAKKAFKEKRRHHYNEFLMMQKARQLMTQDFDEDEDNEDSTEAKQMDS